MHILYLAKTRQLEVVERQEGKVELGGRAEQGAAAKTYKLRHAYSQCMFRLLTFACALSVTATTDAINYEASQQALVPSGTVHVARTFHSIKMYQFT